MWQNSVRRAALTRIAFLLAASWAALWPGTAPAKPYEKPPVITFTATVRESPPRITLEWPNLAGASGYKIYRKALADDAWGTVRATIGESANPRYEDDDVLVGVGYEYQVETVQPPTGFSYGSAGYVYAGIALPAVDNRGTLLLLVDKTLTNALAGELTRLELDLAGDGWSVLRHDVARQSNIDVLQGQAGTAVAGPTGEVAAIRALIDSDYNADPTNVKMVYLVGGVACPVWNPPSWNDYTLLRSDDSAYGKPYGSTVKLGVGRTFLAGLSELGLSETELTRRYLNKAHAFRQRRTAYRVDASGANAISQEISSFPTLVGRNKSDGGFFSGFAAYWVEMSFPLASFVRNPMGTEGVFGLICPEHGDRGISQAAVASSSAYLIFFDFGQNGHNASFNHWLAMGETIGFCQMMNKAKSTLYGVNSAPTLNGDPTIRMRYLAPPGGLTIVSNTLTWTASFDSGDAGFQGYHVYRAATMAGPFTRLTTTPVSDTTWADPSPLAGVSVYQVRAMERETSNTGSYDNQSQGIFATRGAIGMVASAQWVQVPEGGSNSFRVHLSSAPASNVTITAAYASGDASLGVQSGASLTFTPTNWHVQQTVTLAAAWDGDDVNGSAAIRLSAPGLSNLTVGAVMEDAELLVNSSAISMAEGGIGTVQVRLSRPPATSSLTVSTGFGVAPGVTPSIGNDIWVQSGATLTFTQDNWDQWQIVTLGAADVYYAANGATQFKVSAAGYRPAYFTVSCTEAHSLIQPAVVSPAGAGTASPAGYTSVVMGEPTRISATPAPGYRFAYWCSGSADFSPGFADPTAADTTVTLYYKDMYKIVANFVPTNQSVVTNTIERETLSVGVPIGGTATFRVRLTVPPVTNVTVGAWPVTGMYSGNAPVPSDPDITVQSGALTFTPTNWNVWQSITLAASREQTAGAIGRAFIAVGGSGLFTAYVSAQETDPNVTVSVRAGPGGLSATPEVTTAGLQGMPVAIRATANLGYRFDHWTVVSGLASLADAHAPCTTVTPESSATLVAEFRLVSSNQPPAITAIWADPVVVTPPAGTTLHVAANDAQGGALDYFWSLESGPGSATFTAPYASVTPVSFSQAGSYLLRVAIGNARGEIVVGKVTVVVAGVVTDVSALRVPEGSTNSFRVKLASQPDADVTVTALRTTGDADITVSSGASRTFSSANWNDWQTVVLAAGEDTDAAEGTAAIALSCTGVSGITTVLVTEADNDATLLLNAGAGGTVAPTGAQIVNRGVATPIVATPAAGHTFLQWVITDGAAALGNNQATNTTVTITEGSATLRANFVDNTASNTVTTWSWGDNSSGQLCDGTTTNRFNPTEITFSGVEAFSAGGMHALARRPDGTVWAWGKNEYGQLGDGSTNAHYMASLVGVSNVSAIAAGGFHSVALQTNGTVWAWGRNENGQLGTGDTGWGKSNPVQILNFTGVTQIAAGTWHTVARKNDGTLWAWGNNGGGQLGDGTSGTNRLSPVQVKLADNTALSNVTVVAARGEQTIAVKDDGTVWEWGRNGYNWWFNIPGFWLQASNHIAPVQVKLADNSALSHVIAVAAGDNHAVALKDDGTVWTWGVSAYVNSYPIGNLTPVQVAISNVVAVAAGLYHTLAIKDDGSVWAWGGNLNGQLGIGTTDEQTHLTPVQAVTADGLPLSGAFAIGANGNYSLVSIRKQNTVRLVTSASSVLVPEGGTATFQVKLSFKPPRNVTVSAQRTSGDSDIACNTNLLFTTNNWNTYQTVPLTAAEDADTTDGSAVITLAGSEGVDVGITLVADEVDNDIQLTVYATPGGAATPAATVLTTPYARTSITATPSARYIFANWSVVSGTALIADPYATNTTVMLLGSASVQANFLPLGENRPPRISAEAWADPAEVRLPEAVTTVGVGAEDPDGDALSYAWSQVSGVGTANFATPFAAESLVTFTSDGVFLLRVTVSDGRGGVASSDVSVLVNRLLALPAITRQPVNLLVCAGELAGFGVVATGEELSYQWYRNGVAIFSGTDAGYNPPVTTLADNGAKFKVQVYNASGSVMSDEATLTVLNAAQGTGLTGKHYDNMDFTGLYLTDVARPGSRALDPRDSTFSKRWTGQIRPQFTETYWFNVRAGSDARLWVNGVLLVDAWRGADADLGFYACAPIQLEAGQVYDLRLDMRGDMSHGNGPWGYSYDGGIWLGWAGLLTTAGVLPNPGYVPIPYGEAAVGVPVAIPAARLYPTLSGSNYPPQITRATIADSPVCLPAGTTVTLAAADMDDDPLTYAWSQVSGPGTATFTTPSGTFTSVTQGVFWGANLGAAQTCATHFVSMPVAPTSTVTFSTAGTYLLRATVSDNQGHSVTSDVSVTVVGADVPPYLILSSPTAGVQEGQDYSGGVNVRLSKAPAGSFQLTVSRAGSTTIDTQGTIPSFSPSDWSTYKSVSFRSYQDADTNSDIAAFTFSATGYASATCSVTQVDNDTTLTVAAGSGGSVSPVGAVVVTKGAATAIYAVGDSGYNFSGWSVRSGTATVANAGTVNTTVSITAPATVQANFVPAPIALIRSATSVRVPEGSIATFQLKLSCQPTGTVSVAVARTSGDNDLAVSSGASLTFTTNNWGSYQTVTLAAAEDADAANGAATFTCSAADMLSMAVTATEEDNDNSTLTLQAGVGGTAAPSGDRLVIQGSAVAISATPDEGYTFENWSVPSGSATFGNRYATNTTVTLSTIAATVQANFTWVGLTLAAPVAFTATAVATNQINLAWSDQATNETGYLVERSLNSSTWVPLVVTSANVTNYSNAGLATNTLYYYRVAASNAAGLSTYRLASARTWTAYEAWQHTQFDSTALTNAAISSASADPDHDGLSNEQEYWAGTDPTNATSCLAITALTNNPVVAGGGFVLRWQSVAGKSYCVQAATNLASSFDNLTNGLLATPPLNVHTDTTVNAGQKFYRVGVEIEE